MKKESDAIHFQHKEQNLQHKGTKIRMHSLSPNLDQIKTIKIKNALHPLSATKN